MLIRFHRKNWPYHGRISIHLMLMLIMLSMMQYPWCIDFNTSHVNVNRQSDSEKWQRESHFNTSHVNVNQNTPMVGGKENDISIHLMLMLISKFTACISRENPISIHLMLMLILCLCVLDAADSIISIHLMLMLILLVSSSAIPMSNFNTSHVNVNPTNLSLFNHA